MLAGTMRNGGNLIGVKLGLLLIATAKQTMEQLQLDRTCRTIGDYMTCREMFQNGALIIMIGLWMNHMSYMGEIGWELQVNVLRIGEGT